MTVSSNDHKTNLLYLIIYVFSLIPIPADVGAYTYGLGHLMKPHRMRITHELAMAYGMLDKMNVLVSMLERPCPKTVSRVVLTRVSMDSR